MIEVQKIKGRTHYKYWREGLRSQWHQATDLSRLEECKCTAHALRQRIAKTNKDKTGETLYELMTMEEMEMRHRNNYSKRKKVEHVPADWGLLWKCWTIPESSQLIKGV